MEKFEKVLRIVAFVGAIVAFWALGLNQVGDLVDKARDTQVSSAQAQCAVYGIPHAVIDDNGTAWCYAVYQGTEEIVPLETLQELYADPSLDS